MAVAGQPIEAVLTLNASNFHTEIGDATTNVKNFVNQISRSTGQVNAFEMALRNIVTTLNNANLDFTKFNEQAKGVESFNKFANGVKALATSVEILGNESKESSVGLERVRGIITSLEGTFGTAKVEVTGLANALKELNTFEQQTAQQTTRSNQATANLRNSYMDAKNTVMSLARAFSSERASLLMSIEAMKQYDAGATDVKQSITNVNNSLRNMSNQYKANQLEAQALRNTLMQLDNVVIRERMSFEQASASLTKNSEAMRLNAEAKLRAMGYTGQLSTSESKLSTSEQKVASTTNQATSSIQRQSTANRSATASTNQLSSATSRLGKAMSSLRMMGSLVGSMLAYNFAHKLLVATGETIHAKSEMEGYFKMLHFGQGEIDKFNSALDQTVQRFQRVNKYSLGETISSIGVEFNLTTDEMIKAMDVTSMITSEYLRAGRNANEASLAVKDVLQGQFQRLSRETGVKGEQLKEAGWNGDVTDVNSLLDALRKVAEDRNWNVFAEKANSINDILTILQNRFGEWSADMVNMVQPAIVGAFNAIMDVAGSLAQSLSGVWKWLVSDNWVATGVKIAGLVTAVVGLAGAFVKLRTGATLVQISQMGMLRTIGATVLGLKAEEVATLGLRGAIAQRITGLTAEQVAQVGSTQAIYGKILGLDSELMAEEGLVGAINASIISREAETVATVEQAGANIGFIGALTAVITGEEIATGTTLSFAEALGVLTAEMLLNPITWFIGALMALAGAYYVATGGLSDHWEKMKTFNETMENSDDIVKQNEEHLKTLGDTLGTDSEIYKFTADAIEGFNQKLGSSKALVKAYDDEIANLGVDLGALSLKNTKGLGLSDESYKELQEYLPALTEGYNTYYHALQVVHKQKEDFDKSDRTLVQNMQDRGADEKDILDKREQHLEHYNNFIKHSAEHNTSEDWWGGTWAGILAGIDSFQIWLDYKTEDLADWWHDFNQTWADIPQQLGDAWKNLQLPDVGKDFGNWINDVKKSLDDSWKSLVESFTGFSDWLSSLPDPSADFGEWLAGAWANFGASVQGFFDDPLGSMGITLPEGWSILSLLGFNTVSATDGSETPTFMEDLSSILGFNIQTWLNNFQADPMGTLGIDLSGFNIGSFISTLFPSDGGVSILNWVNTSIIQPMTLGIQNGIASIPIIGDIAQMLGLVPQQDQNAFTTGYNLIDNLKRGVEQKISEIPIIGDIAQMLGLIPQQNSNAHDKGQGVGENIKQGEKQGQTGTAQNVASEMGDVITAISNSVGKAFSTAQQVGSAIWGGINSILQRHSPGFIHDQVQAEFGTDIPNAILSGGDSAYANAQYYGQQISDGISSVNLNSFGTFATDYESDAQMINATTQMMGMDTTTAFNDMSMAVNSTTSSMGANVTSTYTSMQTKQSSMLNTMKTQNTSAYNDMYQKSNQSLIHMRDSTSNITHQMTNAWNTMKNNIVQSAHQLQHDSTVHFNTLSNTIGGFYRKIQNPSSWGGSPHGGSTHRNVSAGRRIASSFTGGRKYSGGRGSTYTGDKTMTIAQLKKKICPNGDCNGIFDGWSSTDVVDVRSFLSLVEDGGFGSWSDWHNTHYSHIKNKSDQWGMKSPTINLVGGIPTNANYKVGDFENGTPKISFSSFQSMAESIFSEIPYRFYYNSDWKGSWLGALQAGACNCWDGANALLAFAQSCGFGGGIQHGTWVDPDGTSYPHVYAVINGKKMDTTGWQQRRSWSAGSPTARVGNATRVKTSNDNTNVSPTIIVNINEPVYGVDDLDSKITDGVDKGLQRHFNKSYAIGI